MKHRYIYYDNAINEKDCDDLINQYKDQMFEKGEVRVEGKALADQARKANIIWIEQNSFVARAVLSYIQEANQYFKVNLARVHEPAQLTKYDKIGDKYDWHIDDISYKDDEPSIRSLSAIVQLSKPENYSGCELQLFNGEQELEVLPIKKQGSIIVFRSYEWHRVTELISGERYSLILWGHGQR